MLIAYSGQLGRYGKGALTLPDAGTAGRTGSPLQRRHNAFRDGRVAGFKLEINQRLLERL